MKNFMRIPIYAIAAAVVTAGVMAAVAAVVPAGVTAALTTASASALTAGTRLAGAWVSRAAAAAPVKSVRVEVNGMVCAFCAAAIDKKLSALPETRAVYVNLEKKIVALELKAGKSVNLDKIRAEIRDAGYDVVQIAGTDQTLAQIKASVK